MNTLLKNKIAAIPPNPKKHPDAKPTASQSDIAPTPVSIPAPRHVYQISQSFKEVKKMQESMQILAKKIDWNTFEALSGNWTSESKRLQNIINLIKIELGSFKVDGIWGNQTAKMLKYLRDFSEEMLKIGSSLHEVYFTKEDLSEFDSILTAAENRASLSSEQKKDYAIRLTSLINKIISYYEFLALRDVDRKYIKDKDTTSGRLSYSEKGTNPDALTPEEEQYVKLQSTGIRIPPLKSGEQFSELQNIPEFKGAGFIPFSALTSKEEYFKWMASKGIKDTDFAERVFAEVISPAVNKMQSPVEYNKNISLERAKTINPLLNMKLKE